MAPIVRRAGAYVAACVLLVLSAGALVASVTDEPEGEEETVACVRAADDSGSDNPVQSCDDGGPGGFGAMAAGFALAALVVLGRAEGWWS